MELRFLGATETVTGSKYLLSLDDFHILIDCGLFQGDKELRLRNWNPLPFDPQKLSAVIVTHAHIDHSGYLPLLVKKGFNGPIYSSMGTKDLCTILLPDSAHLQEEDAKHANQFKYSKHMPALPLYTIKDAEKALLLFKPQPYNSPISLHNDLQIEFIPGGHIIGASIVRIKAQGKTIVFTGDLGRLHDPVMLAPTIIKEADYLITESTYGDRLHETEQPKILIKDIVNKTFARGGSLIIPAFAVGRTQSILYYLYELKKEKAIPDLPIYLDSPMAIDATDILHKHREDLRLSMSECEQICSLPTCTRDPNESIQLDINKEPKIIISASGMATGGRILFHFATYVTDPRNTILFTGFQARGTRGAKMLSGIAEIKLHGQIYPILAQLENIRSTSAHADYAELLQWLKHFSKAPKKTFITHGEHEAAHALQAKIQQELHWNCIVPQYNQTEQLL